MSSEFDDVAREPTRSIEPGEPVLAEIVDAADPLADVAAEQLSYLHPSSLIFDLLSHGRTYLVPAAFGLLGAARGDLTLLIISALIFIPAVVVSVVRYFTLKYCIAGGKLIVTQGLIFRQTRTVPVSRIQNIDFVQNLLHRAMNVAEVKVETASGTKPEAVLRVLSMAKMESLREAVFGSSDHAFDETALDTAESTSERAGDFAGSAASALAAHAGSRTASPQRTADRAPVTLLKIPLGWLFKAGLASNRGLLMVGVALGGYFQFANRDYRFKIGWIREYLPAGGSVWTLGLTLLIVAIVGLVAIRLLGIGWYVLRFFGYELAKRGDDLRISCGLLTKVSATVPRQRVQFISIHRNLIMRAMGLASIRIETAGGAGQNSENATETVSKRWFVPVLPESEVSSIITMLRPEIEWNERTLDFRPLSRLATRRLTRIALAQSLLVTAVISYFWWPWGLACAVVLTSAAVAWARKKSRAMRYARTDNGVVFRSGVFNRKTSVTFFEKIQTLRVDQSPFDRRWKMAKLSIDTAAAGPAEHRIAVPYLDADFANSELQELRIKTGQEQPVFG